MNGTFSKTEKRNVGFTLLELLLYVGIISMLMVVLVLFVSSVASARIKSQAISEVESQGMQALYQITQAVRNAEGINAPSVGSAASSLSLAMADASKNPTVFDVFEGAIRMQEGTNSQVILLNSRVEVSGFTVENISRLGTPGITRIQFVLSHQNPENEKSYEYQQSFYGSSAIRQ